jgi:hypothetical protein
VSHRRLVEALVRSTQALERAVESDDLIGLATALQTREEAVATLQRAEAIDAETRSMLASVGDRDRVLEVKARERLEHARTELARLRQARRSLRTARGEAPPRFVSRRA